LATVSIAALPLLAQDSTAIDAAKLKEMIVNLGYETKTLNEEAGKEKYEFTVKNASFDIPIAAEISPSKNYIWLTVFLGEAPPDSSPKMAGFVKRNFKIQPSMFYITDKDNLMMGFAMENRGMNPAVLRRTVTKLQEDVTNTADLWSESSTE
jgi:hypothetical protein